MAGAAEVSPGFVQHHFGTKAGLREAFDEYVIAVTTQAFEDVLRVGQQGDVWSINRHLPEPFSTPTQMQRWNAATTDLYRRGVSAPALTQMRCLTGDVAGSASVT